MSATAGPIVPSISGRLLDLLEPSTVTVTDRLAEPLMGESLVCLSEAGCRAFAGLCEPMADRGGTQPSRSQQNPVRLLAPIRGATVTDRALRKNLADDEPTRLRETQATTLSRCTRRREAVVVRCVRARLAQFHSLGTDAGSRLRREDTN